MRLPGGGYRKARTFVGEVPAALARCCRAVLENCSSTITSLGSNLSSLNMGKQTPAPLQCSQYSSLETTPGPTRHHASTRAHTPLYVRCTIRTQSSFSIRRCCRASASSSSHTDASYAAIAPKTRNQNPDTIPGLRRMGSCRGGGQVRRNLLRPSRFVFRTRRRGDPDGLVISQSKYQ